MPADVTVRAESRNGAVEAAGFATGLTLSSHNGAIQVTDSTGGPLELESRNGRISATGVAADQVLVNSHNGSIHLSLRNAPARIETESRNGSTTVEVPGTTTYQVSTTSSDGSVDVSVPQGDSEHSISVRSHNGGITIRSTSD